MMPDLSFTPTPAWLRFQREAKARQRRARLNAWRLVAGSHLHAWWQEWRLAVAVALLLLLGFVPLLAGAAAEREQLLATLAQSERRAADYGELALALSRGQRGRQVSIRIAADGTDDALVQLERLRTLLLAQRGEARP